MANLGGFTLKKIERTRGMEGYGVVADMYLDGKKVGIYEDYGDGALGMARYENKDAEKQFVLFAAEYADVHPNSFMLDFFNKNPERYEEEKERLKRCHPYIPEYLVTPNVVAAQGVFEGCLVDDYLKLLDHEKQFKKMEKKGYGLLMCVERKNGLEDSISFPAGWSEEKINAEMEKVLKNMGDTAVSYTLYDSKESFNISRGKALKLLEKAIKRTNDEIWCAPGKRGSLSYCNSHIRVELVKKEFTKEDKAKFVEIIADDTVNERIPWQSLRNVFGAAVNKCDGYDFLEFDIGKGCFDAAERLSKFFPDAVVFVNDDWDDHAFAVYKNGEEYGGYEASWAGGEPEMYEEDGMEYYDCDVMVNISLPFDGLTHTTYSGGGMCSKEEFENYKSVIEGTCRQDKEMEER